MHSLNDLIKTAIIDKPENISESTELLVKEAESLVQELLSKEAQGRLGGMRSGLRRLLERLRRGLFGGPATPKVEKALERQAISEIERVTAANVALSEAYRRGGAQAILRPRGRARVPGRPGIMETLTPFGVAGLGAGTGVPVGMLLAQREPRVLVQEVAR